MYSIGVFSLGIAITMAVVLAVVLFLKNPLYVVLSDLCGPARARFWTVFSTLILLIVPFALALGLHPIETRWRGSFFEISSQMQASLIGFGVALIALGWMLTRAIRIQVALRAGGRPEKIDRA